MGGSAVQRRRSGRPLCAKSGLSRTKLRTHQFDPNRAFPFAPATEGMRQKAAEDDTSVASTADVGAFSKCDTRGIRPANSNRTLRRKASNTTSFRAYGSRSTSKTVLSLQCSGGASLIEIADADADARQLLNALEKGEIVLVLGAGASATSTNSKGQRVRQSSSLAALLASEAGLHYNGEDLPDVIGAVLGPRISAVQFHRILAAEYTKITPSPELADLLGYTWRRLYTWNVDDLIENIHGGVQRRRYFNGMIDKVVAHEGLSYLPVIHLHGEALKPEHGFIFGVSEYNARLNNNTHDWYREAAADYAAYTPLFIGSKLKEPILSAELDRARPNPDAGLGRGNCSGPRLRFQAAQGRGRPPRVRRMASMARIDLRRAVSTTDRISA